MCLDTDFFQELEYCSICSCTQFSLSLQLVSLDPITSSDAILVQDIDKIGSGVQLENLLCLSLNDEVTDIRLIDFCFKVNMF